MQYTTNLNLKKPEYTDPADIQNINDNMDVIDEQLAEKASQESLNTTNQNLANTVKIKSNITILSSGWVDDTATSGFYIYDISDTDITATTIVDVNIKLTDLEKASDLKSANESFEGCVRLYADTAPTENIICDLRLTKVVV